jgi:hypothetical protein
MKVKRKRWTIRQGETFQRVVRWEQTPLVYAAITAIGNVAPARVTATAHGLVNGWRVAVQSVSGMTQINAVNDPPQEDDFTQAIVVDANTVELTDVNAQQFSPYTSGGYLVSYTRPDLTGYTGQLVIVDPAAGTVLYTMAPTTNVVIDPTLATITLTIPAAATALLTFSAGRGDLELTSPAGVVTAILDVDFDLLQGANA